MGLKSYGKKTQIIKTLLEVKKPRQLVMKEDIKRLFKMDKDDDKSAPMLLEMLRRWHIVRYFNISKKATGGYIVTDYAEDQLNNRLKWESSREKIAVKG